MGRPARSLKFAIAFLERVTTGFWPLMPLSSSTAVSMIFGFATAAPRPMLTTIFWRRGTSETLFRLSSFWSAAMSSFL